MRFVIDLCGNEWNQKQVGTRLWVHIFVETDLSLWNNQSFKSECEKAETLLWTLTRLCVVGGNNRRRLSPLKASTAGMLQQKDARHRFAAGLVRINVARVIKMKKSASALS